MEVSEEAQLLTKNLENISPENRVSVLIGLLAWAIDNSDVAVSDVVADLQARTAG